MPAEEQITAYVEAPLKRDLETLADEAELSLSAYVAQLLDRHVNEEEIAQKNRELRAEQRITNLVAEAHDRIVQDSEQMRELLAKQAVYTVALWELEKRDAGDLLRQDALEVGAERLREDIEQIGVEFQPADD
jgi:predicted transcriptional regulator YheO